MLMNYFSTRNKDASVSASRAILQGISEDGGLFVPERFPQVDLKALRQYDYAGLAAYLLGLYLTDYTPSFLEETAAEVYGGQNFEGKTANLVETAPGEYVMELWHGPTCAFKDYALQIMPKLLVEAKKICWDDSRTLILVATSGDTGKAALEGYKNIAGVDIAVFYPDEGTSEIQRLQMATQEGENVAVFAARGNFDQVQSGLKQVFTDEALKKKMAASGHRFSSANSINWGRLAPQIVYYFSSYLALVEQGAVRLGEAVDYCVPTGNFGDILAGYYAKRMGLPVGRLICASNQNNVLTDFLNTGVYDIRREFYKTTSPSMDILISSNLERLLYHVTEDCGYVASLMQDLKENGVYTVSPEVLEKIRADFACGCATDEEVEAQIRICFKNSKYLSDTHTAVAFKVAADHRKGQPAPRVTVVSSTASPYKFPKAVIKALGGTVPEDDFEAISRLENMTNTPAPESLCMLRQKPVRFSEKIDPAAIASLVSSRYEG